mmetsp:Transcript_86518/g.175925  ORF Transcript_86518/g.175925 Transcript_86518/m.175925 type:complete len:310 (+) Transcript_86518:2415-3344(+)
MVPVEGFVPVGTRIGTLCDAAEPIKIQLALERRQLSMAEIPRQDVRHKQIGIPHHKGIALRKPTHDVGVLLSEHLHELSRKRVGMARRRTRPRRHRRQGRGHRSSPATVLRSGHRGRSGHGRTRAIRSGCSRTTPHYWLQLDDPGGHASRHGHEYGRWRRCRCHRWVGGRCDLSSWLVVLLIDAVIVLAEIVVAVLCTIEALPQGFLVVGIGRVWHRQRRLCRQRLSRLCRRLESGQIHGSKLFAHARGGLTVLLVALSIAFFRQNFIQCRIHRILQRRHVHAIHVCAVQNRSRGVCRLARQVRWRTMR